MNLEILTSPSNMIPVFVPYTNRMNNAQKNGGLNLLKHSRIIHLKGMRAKLCLYISHEDNRQEHKQILLL
jgi:hypothetical protein